MKIADTSSVCSAIILAGGDGMRLRPFIRQLLGSDLPKQYIRIIGTRSLLQHTFDRTERLIPANRVYTVLTKNHLQYPEARKQIQDRAPHTVVIQPTNKGTGPGLLLPLMHIHKRRPDSIVAVFPSDHLVLQENLFEAYVRQAVQIVEASPHKIIFLGAEPNNNDPEYGYILPEFEISTAESRAQSIKAFIEEPELNLAARIISIGALWNTQVIFFKSKTLLDLIHSSSPKLYNSFQRIGQSIGTPQEYQVLEKTYREMEPVDFHKDLTGLIDLYSQNQLSLIQMRGVSWSALGCANRIVSVLERLNWMNRVRYEIMQDNVWDPFSAEAAEMQLVANL
jgi:mannose-1-phosphate guanylyltransferase